MDEMDEIEEQKMSRFLRDLNFNIAHTVELYPYYDFDTLCGLCLKLETQGKTKYGGGSSMEYGKAKPWFKLESTSKLNASPSPVGASNPTVVPKLASSTKETSLSKV